MKKFKKKKIYKIRYKAVYEYNTLVVAKSEIQAIKKFNKHHGSLDIISVEEYKTGENENENKR